MDVSALKRSLFVVPLGLAVALVATPPAVSQTTAPTQGKTTAKTKPRPAAKALLDLNSATAKEMETELPGVGAVTAAKIVAGRPYAKIDDLARAGVPIREIDAIRSHVRVVPPRPATGPTRTRPMNKADVARTGAPVTGPKVNLNTATVKELEELPGIGAARAKHILDGRPYTSVDDLERVKGLSRAEVAAIRDRVVVTRPAAPLPKTASRPPATKPAMTKPGAAPRRTTTETPARSGKLVNLNTATQEELEELPGIGPVKSQAIIDARPFTTPEDVMKVKGIKEGEFAKIKELIRVK